MIHVRLKKCSVVVIVIMIEVEDSEEERMGLAKPSLGRRVGISLEYSWSMALGEAGLAFAIGATGQDCSLLDHSLFQKRGSL